MPHSTQFSEEWRKSSHSDGGGGCVEARRVEGGVEVRDTKDRSKPAHFYTNDEWDKFVKGVRDGDFDL